MSLMATLISSSFCRQLMEFGIDCRRLNEACNLTSEHSSPMLSGSVARELPWQKHHFASLCLATRSTKASMAKASCTCTHGDDIQKMVCLLPLVLALTCTYIYNHD